MMNVHLVRLMDRLYFELVAEKNWERFVRINFTVNPANSGYFGLATDANLMIYTQYTQNATFQQLLEIGHCHLVALL